MNYGFNSETEPLLIWQPHSVLLTPGVEVDLLLLLTLTATATRICTSVMISLAKTSRNL